MSSLNLALGMLYQRCSEIDAQNAVLRNRRHNRGEWKRPTRYLEISAGCNITRRAAKRILNERFGKGAVKP